MDYAQEYIEIHRPDEAMPALFDSEIYNYRRGFTFGMFGSQNVKTGGGKSMAVSAMALDYDPTFTVDRIVFTPADLLIKLSEIERQRIKGAIIVCEEVQNYASNRSWFTLYNKTLIHCIATMRNLQAGVFFITPMSRMIDADVQKMMRFGANSRLKRVNGQIRGYIRPYEIATYNNDKDIARRPLKYYCPETGQVIQLDELRVYMPDKNFVREFEDKVDDYKKNFRSNLLEEAEAFDRAAEAMYKSSGRVSPKQLAETLMQNGDVLSEFKNKGKITQGTVAAVYPNLKSPKDLSAVSWWANSIWDKLKMVQGGEAK